jgi:hypothetical protein
MVRALTRDRQGELSVNTPRPPLLADALAAVRAQDVAPAALGRTVKLDLVEAVARERSRVLHRLRVLGIPGYQRQRGPKTATDGALEEVWVIAGSPNNTFGIEAESALIEAAGYGPTLASAAGRRLEDALEAENVDLGALAAILHDAVFVGVDTLTDRALAAIVTHAGHETDLGRLGVATHTLLGLWSQGVLFGAANSRTLTLCLAACYGRGVWLLEQVAGAAGAADGAIVGAVRALRDVVRLAARGIPIVPDELVDVCGRRAGGSDAPPAVRGACLGALWSLGRLGAGDEARDRAVHAVRQASLPTVLGDFLGGLFALAREETVHGDDVLAAIDDAVAALDDTTLLVALPALRLAFGYFPPREKVGIAERVAARHGHAGHGHSLLHLDDEAALVARGLALDAEVEALLTRYGLRA